ncbi:MAG: transcription-repair coupling factor [Chloroflexi bacterium]|nr:transcription-repair coupling factor [Chloroflexota bacterium]
MNRHTPSLAPLLDTLRAAAPFTALTKQLAKSDASLIHVPHAAKAQLGAALAADRRIVWVARDPEVAERVADALRSWFHDPASVVLLEPRSALPYERGELVIDESAGRVATLAAWHEGSPRILVTSLLAVAQPTISLADLRAETLLLRAGDRIALDAVTSRAIALGYEAVPLVGGRGEIARRGGIVDLFPAGETSPLRIEWFGDEIESIRRIDPSDQRSREAVPLVQLLPASEFPLDAARVAAARATAQGIVRGGGETELPPRLEEDLARWEAGIAARNQAERGDGLELWSVLLTAERAYDQVGDALVVLDEPGELRQAADALSRQTEERADVLRTTRLLPTGWPSPIPEGSALIAALAATGRQRLALTWSSDPTTLIRAGGDDSFGWHDPVVPSGRSRALTEGLETWRRDKARVLIVSEQAARIAELITEGGERAVVSEGLLTNPKPGSLTILTGGLDGGFQGGVDGLTVITDRELFGATRVRRPAVHRRGITREAAERLTPGDYLVHVDHGVGRFVGMLRRGGDGDQRDYLEIAYGGTDTVFTPVEQLARIARYTGSEHPQLSRLGGGEWRRAKERAKKAADDLADELLRIYAARELAHRPAITPGSPWLSEFEAAFPYRETPDQLTAIEATKGDLSRPRPMDRVIVGDVGYGKTEVALRAAFAVLEAGRQVAVLVPTTVLALQHIETFRRRLAAYPFKLELLSRSVSAARQAEIVAKIATGEVDLVVATHRLLSKDVVFKHLGLLVVDEEHRFGVAAKERMKSLRAELDVMTLTATPIPRTLNLALSGIRDLSTIETPPEDRHPVATRVTEASLELVRDALLRELERGGQSYYVHNRVESIEAAAEQIRRLVPDARVVVGHGQMEERALERVMGEFVRGEAQILVCTTIIESGLDIPNANTIIIDRADRLGLAQLYQLRGRVGRSSRRAWCYLLYRREEALTDDARKRLKAIFDASHLGAGFQLALADLEIRGAGDLLGGEQSGHIAAVGFDLYSQLLADAVEVRRASREGREPARRRTAALIDLPVSAHFAESYVADEGQRLDLYRRLGIADSDATINAIAEELRDRFGAPPAEAERLLEVARLRAGASEAGLASLLIEEGRLIVRLGELQPGLAARALVANPTPELSMSGSQIRSRERVTGGEAWRLAARLVQGIVAEVRRWEATNAAGAPLA